MDQLPLHDYSLHWPFMAARGRYTQPLANTSKKLGVGLQTQGSAPQHGKNKGFAQNCDYSLHLPQKRTLQLQMVTMNQWTSQISVSPNKIKLRINSFL